MDKQDIIKEIIRTTKENDGIPLGQKRFKTETGIKIYDWCGKHWAKWGDALKEAGFSPNTLNKPYDEKYLIERLVFLIKELKKFPSNADISLKAHNIDNFPSPHTFDRLGTTTKRADKILRYCEGNSGYQDVAEICRKYIASFSKKSGVQPKETESEIGYVYLMKSGNYYKLGRSTNVQRRNYEIGIKLPEKFERVHQIATDDPAGIEVYWHNIFKDKRKQGEWFALSANDIKAFKKWKKIA